MSIEDTLALLELSKDIEAHIAASSAKRRLFMTKSAKADLSANGALAVLGVRPHVRAAFDHWVEGALIPNEGTTRPGFLKQLDPPPPEVWEIRVTLPSPQCRAIGRFICSDTLLITGIRTRSMLGKLGSAEWEKVCADSVDQWVALFGHRNPFVGATYQDYVTENCDAFRLGQHVTSRGGQLRSRARKARGTRGH